MAINLISATPATTISQDPTTAQIVQREIDNNVTTDLSKEVQTIEQQLYNDAKEFLENTENIFKKLKDDLNLAERMNQYRQQVQNSKQSEDIESKVSVYYSAYKELSGQLLKRTGLIKEFYKYMMKFHSKINLVLEQEIEMVFVFYNKGNPIILSQDGVKFIEPQLREGVLNLRYRLTQKSVDLNSTKILFKADEIADLTTAYKETRWRFNYIKEKTKHKVKNNKTKEQTFDRLYIVMYELPDNVWHGVSVSSLGDINEAYATFALHHLNSLFEGIGLEQKVEKFLLGVPNINIQGVFGVDSESGLLAGDTYSINKEGQRIAETIKSDRASVMSIDQVLKLAQIIVGKNGTFGKQDLQSIQSFLHGKTPPVRNQIINDLKGYVLQHVNENVLYDIQGTIHSRR